MENKSWEDILEDASLPQLIELGATQQKAINEKEKQRYPDLNRAFKKMNTSEKEDYNLLRLCYVSYQNGIFMYGSKQYEAIRDFEQQMMDKYKPIENKSVPNFKHKSKYHK